MDKIFSVGFMVALFVSCAVSAQEKILNNKSPYPVTYKSETDQIISVKTVILAPVYDNVGGVYRAAAEKKLVNLINQDVYWALAPMTSPSADEKFSSRPDWFDDKPDFTKAAIIEAKADALLHLVVTKSSSGLTANLTLYLKDGQPLIGVSNADPKAFEISRLDEMVEQLYLSLKQKLPYVGTVLSRAGNQVTINVGEKKGLKVGDRVSLAQILSIKRHPKLRFMTGVEKELIGQIALTRVDSELSFGTIAFEKESGVITKGSKILALQPIRYDGLSTENDFSAEDKSIGEWVPTPTPQFGKITGALGFTDFSISAVDRSANKSFSSSQKIAPTLKLGVELWFTPEWFGTFEIEQSLFTAQNGLAGSSPGHLSFTRSIYDLGFGYKYFIDQNFWGPQLTASAGLLFLNSQVSDSAPTAFTSTKLGAMQIQIGGYLPVTDDYKNALGANVKIVFFENYSESPVNSGSADAGVNQMGVYFSHQYSTNIQFKPQINFSTMTTSFSGNASRSNALRSSEEKMVSVLFGVEYLF